MTSCSREEGCRITTLVARHSARPNGLSLAQLALLSAAIQTHLSRSSLRMAAEALPEPLAALLHRSLPPLSPSKPHDVKLRTEIDSLPGASDALRASLVSCYPLSREYSCQH